MSIHDGQKNSILRSRNNFSLKKFSSHAQKEFAIHKKDVDEFDLSSELSSGQDTAGSHGEDF